MENLVTISSGELRRLFDEGPAPFIFDLREADAFTAWRIEGRTELNTLNIPQSDFAGEEEKYMDMLPWGREILTVCAHGDASRYAAEYLRARGFAAVSLEGGMEAWSEFYEWHKVAEYPAVYQIYRTARGCICHMVVSGGRAAVIDPSRHMEHISGLAASLDVTIVHVLDTHLHADHVSGGAHLARQTGAAYYLHPQDAEGGVCEHVPLRDGQVFNLGDSIIEVIHSPGHTPGSVSLLLNGKFLFSGDTIMKTAAGRPDLGGRAGEWAGLLYDTLFSRFDHLRDGIVVLPSHAASIRELDDCGCVSLSLGACRRENELFRLRDREAFLTRVMDSLPENPERYQEIRRVNLGLVVPDEPRLKELEIGPNLCGMRADNR